MAYNEALAIRMHALLDAEPGVTNLNMFGGVCFMANGNMACGIIKEDLMVRVGEAAFAEALSKPHTRPMDFVYHPMVGLVYVAAPGYTSDADLEAWVGQAMAFARTMPEKTAKAKEPATRAKSPR